MMKSTRLLCACACLLPTACATEGGGASGLVLFDPNQHVSGARPLFGGYENDCFKDPTYGLSFTSPAIDINGYSPVCRAMSIRVRAALGITQSPAAGTLTYTTQQRNEMIDNLVGSSNSICFDHIRFLQQWDGNINSTLGLSAEASAGLASVLKSGAARVVAAVSAFLGGARGTMDNAYFNNKTVGMLANAFQAERKKVSDEISAGEDLPVDKFTVSKGIQKVLEYHGDCSIVVGLASAERAVDQAQNPNLDTIKDFFQKIEDVRSQAQQFVNAAPATPPTPPTPPGP